MVAIMVIAYSPRASQPSHDATSAVAALATIGLGFIAGIGQPGFAIACAAVRRPAPLR